MELRERFQNLENEFNKSDFISIHNYIANRKKRILYSKLEILRIDLEECQLNIAKENLQLTDTEILDFTSKIDKLSKQLDLKPIKIKGNIFLYVEVVARFLGVICTFVIIGSFFSLLLLIVRVFDELFQMDPFEYISEKIKRSISRCLIFQSGIQVKVKGLSKQQQQQLFASPVSIITFSHASNMDGLLLSATCPLRHLAFGKKELFLVPFFSWISLAFGGVPIDRNKRDRALRAMKRCTEAAMRSQSKVTIAIAPEGTRSLTGQLLPFKKGAFHMWEQLNTTTTTTTTMIVPFVICDAFDMFPAGYWVNQSGGVVVVEFLTAIAPSEAKDRDHMLRLVRRRMLESLQKEYEDRGELKSGGEGGLGGVFRVVSFGVNCVVVILSLWSFCVGYDLLVVKMNVSITTIMTVVVVGSVLITMALFVYNVYILDFLDKKNS